MLVDTHCHLSSVRYQGNVEGEVNRARKAGVEKIIVPSVNYTDLKLVVDIAQKHDGVCGLGGVYPDEIVSLGDHWEEEVEKIKKIVSDNDKIIGFGEIGIDRYRDVKNVDLQKKVFKKQMLIAAEIGVPVAVHNREAEKDIMSVIDELENLPEGHFHCWSGDKKFLDYVLEKGFYVGVCGNVTYPNSKNLRDVIKKVPLDRILIETDSPFLAPQNKRGERNEPQNVKIIAEFLAELLDLPLDSFIKQSTENAKRLYRI